MNTKFGIIFITVSHHSASKESDKIYGGFLAHLSGYGIFLFIIIIKQHLSPLCIWLDWFLRDYKIKIQGLIFTREESRNKLRRNGSRFKLRVSLIKKKKSSWWALMLSTFLNTVYKIYWLTNSYWIWTLETTVRD